MKKNQAIATLLLIASFALVATAETDKHPEAKPADTVARSESAVKKTEVLEDSARTWQNVFSEAGRRVEIDTASIRKGSDGRVQAYGRIVFEKPLPDAVSSGTYQILEAQNVYDCEKRTFATLRRVFRKDEKTQLRDENTPSKNEMPVRSGTLDERLLRSACRPGPGDKTAFSETASKAKAVADAHVAEPRKELLRTDLGGHKSAAGAGTGTVKATKPAPRPVSRPATHSDNTAQESFEHVHWAYEGRGGPENWGKIDPANKLCDTGKRQSPIDIRDGIRVDLDPINVTYRPSQFRIIDNGHSIQATVGDNRITVLGKEYNLIQFHFHHPSEERIDGRSFDMVAHLVHKSRDGQLAVVAVLIEKGSEHPLIQTLWNYLPLERQQDVFPPGVTIDLNQLLPEKRGYYTYMGSLTTPPCSEGVLWMVMQTPIQASPEQIGIFSRLYPHNARPIQPANERIIKESR